MVLVGNEKKVKHLLDLPNASTHLSLWKEDLIDEGSFDDAINGCSGVFHVATPMDFSSVDPEVQLLNQIYRYILASLLCGRTVCRQDF